MKRLIITILVLSASFIINGCYSFTGASIPVTVKTFSVQFFENKAQLVIPSFSQEFTESLKDKVLRSSPLDLIRPLGDVDFEGTVTNYRVDPVAITSGGEQDRGQANQNRLTVTVQVKCVNSKDEKLSFDQSFTRYADFPKNESLARRQPQLHKLIIDQLVDDIFNRAFSNW